MKKGFTLIELLVVVLIIGILSAVAWPNYQVAVERARITKALPVLRSIRDAQMRYQMATGKETASLDALDISIPYTKKEMVGTDDYQYEGTPIGLMRVVPHAIFYTANYVVLDYYGRNSTRTEIGICYPRMGFESMGERVCSSFGPKTERISGAGTPVYELQF